MKPKTIKIETKVEVCPKCSNGVFFPLKLKIRNPKPDRLNVRCSKCGNEGKVYGKLKIMVVIE